jgi:SPP1 gp7 family putative phage head morphogenesis protein
LDKETEKLLAAAAKDGYAKGAGRAFDDVRQAELRLRRPEIFTPEHQAGLRDFYEGSREEFLRSSFARPVGTERIKVLAKRSFDDLEGITQQMAKRMGRILMDGLTQAVKPALIGKRLANELGIAQDRAGTIARTEMVRAHSEGQLDAFDDLGIEEVGAQVEFATAGDDVVCPDCEALDGSVFTIDEARGMIPQHPNCRCAWTPWLPQARKRRGVKNAQRMGFATWVRLVNASCDYIFRRVTNQGPLLPKSPPGLLSPPGKVGPGYDPDQRGTDIRELLTGPEECDGDCPDQGQYVNPKKGASHDNHPHRQGADHDDT